MLSESNNTD